MKKIIYFSLITLFLSISCDRTEGPVYDVENGVALAAFNRSVQTYPVDDSGTSFAEILVGVSTISDSDRSVSISIDESSTADPSEYTIDSSSLVIPAGETVAKVRIAGNFESIPETGQTQVTINLDGVEGAILDNPATNRLSHTVNLFRFCPFTNGATFLGDYELTTVIDSPSFQGTFISGPVTLVQGSTVADRSFSASLFGAFGGFGPYTFNISLICNEVVYPSSLDTGLAAGGQGVFIDPPTMSAAYDESDDSVLLINLIENTVAGEVPIQIMLTKL